MSGINNDVNQQQEQTQVPIYTRDDVTAILREFERQRDEQKEFSYKGKQVPEGIPEILDATPASDLKDDIKRYKKQIPRYNHGEWTKNQQINKEFIPDLKKWKVATHQVVSSIFKLAEGARLQARASTEIFELLETIEDKLQFRNEDQQTFITAMSQAAKLAVFGFTQARNLDQDAKEYATKALRLPASLRHVEQEEDNLLRESYQQPLTTTTVEDEVSHREDMVVDRDLSAGPILEIFNQEDEAVEPLRPLQSITIPQTATTTMQQTSNEYNSAVSSMQQVATNTKQSTESNITNTTITTTATTTTTSTKSISESRESESTTITTHKLFDPGRWNITEGTYCEVLPQLDKGDHSSLAIKNSQGGLQNTIFDSTNTLEDSSSPSQPIGTARNRISDTEILDSGDHREEQQPTILQPVSLEVLHHPGTNQEETNLGLQKIKPVHTGPAFQDGRRTRLKRTHRKRRLHSKIRSKRCLHCSSNPSKFKTISGISASRNYIHLQGTKLWVKYSTKNFFKATKIRPRTFAKRRYSIGLFSRRYLHTGSREGAVAEVSGQDHDTSRVVRLHSEQKQECINSIAHSGLPGIHIRYQEDDNQGTGEEDQEPETKTQASATGSQEIMPMDGQPNGEDDSNDTGSSGSPSAHPLSAERSNKIVDGKSLKLGESILVVTPSEGGNKLVADVSDREEWITNQTNTDDGPIDNYIHGQLRHRIGGGITINKDARILDNGREGVVHQRKRADGHLFCAKAPCTKVQKQDDKGTVGGKMVRMFL
ncbi:hypothetical protein G6F46_011111 [Rhizopus delemar]|uniref:Uncharacterized protein n=2 Tax=Rhizopus TaxID=4842 RepID=A0A9P6YTN1_9FUNG|nr:hypothetical protein G6F55_011294 [Rhizopus delemar]KAG1535386.1 hypothetical protein G6F51_011565 [Rhizopus arrhizus]KAG1489755.1 hypothetical protein G6F54_011209 [Rhizopus delemar]KAG1501555.1 hypothetical protein G6F53_011053 [Rhizopus delemar]KAG1515632.1 hypothetical protein G6F52_009632 [Rhizopus delemar]